MEPIKDILKGIASGTRSVNDLVPARLGDQRVIEFFHEKNGQYINSQTGAAFSKEQFHERNASRQGIIRTVVFKNFSNKSQ